MRYVAGIDLGKRADYTVLSVLELLPQSIYRVLGLERWRGSDYNAVADVVAEILATPPLDGQVEVWMDTTGVGDAVIETYDGIWRRGKLRGRVHRLTTTSGMEPNPAKGTIPKADLVARLEVALQEGRLLIPERLHLAPALRAELADFAAKVSKSGHVAFEALGSGHDDMVMSLCLALHGATRRKAPTSWRYSGARKAPAWSGAGDPGPDPDDRSTVRWGGWGQAL
jgi:Terminase RNaseH-like domain